MYTNLSLSQIMCFSIFFFVFPVLALALLRNPKSFTSHSHLPQGFLSFQKICVAIITLNDQRAGGTCTTNLGRKSWDYPILQMRTQQNVAAPVGLQLLAVTHHRNLSKGPLVRGKSTKGVSFSDINTLKEEIIWGKIILGLSFCHFGGNMAVTMIFLPLTRTPPEANQQPQSNNKWKRRLGISIGTQRGVVGTVMNLRAAPGACPSEGAATTQIQQIFAIQGKVLIWPDHPIF